MFVKVEPAERFLFADREYLNVDNIVKVSEHSFTYDKQSGFANSDHFIVTLVGGECLTLEKSKNKEFEAYFKDNRYSYRKESQCKS